MNGLTPEQLASLDALSQFPEARLVRVGITGPALSTLRASWQSMNPLQRYAQAQAVSSAPDAIVAAIAANFPAPTDAGVSAVRGVNQPVAPNVDDLWYDTGNDLWKRWNGTAWVSTSGGSAVDATARASVATLSSTVTGNTAAISTLSTTVSGLSSQVASFSGGVSGGSTGGSPVVLYTAGAYALRSTVTSSSTTPVEWRGPVPPTIGGGYMLTIDTWTNTSAVT